MSVQSDMQHIQISHKNNKKDRLVQLSKGKKVVNCKESTNYPKTNCLTCCCVSEQKEKDDDV